MRTTILIVCALVVLVPLTFQKQQPTPDPSPAPDELSELAVEIQTALEGQPDDMAARYAGWFRAIADTLANGDESIPQLRKAWVKADQIIDLPGVLGDIVKRETADYETTGVDRDDYAAVWVKLADACEELTTGGD